MGIFAALDFETADRGRDSACALAIVRVEGSRITAREHRLPEARVRVHLSPRDLLARREGPADVRPGLALDGAAARRRDIHRCPQCQLRSRRPRRLLFGRPRRPPGAAIRVHGAARAGALESPSDTRLPDVCRHLGIALNHHNALSDAEACARIVIAAQRKAPKLRLSN